MTRLLVLNTACHTASISITLVTRALMLPTIDPSNETFDYPRVNYLI